MPASGPTSPSRPMASTSGCATMPSRRRSGCGTTSCRRPLAFARANGLNRIVMDSPHARFGIAARGRGYATLRQALHDAGITEELARMAGLRIWKVGLAWPLDGVGAREFARGLEEIMVVEDRRPVIEPQLREALYYETSRPRDRRQDRRAGPPAAVGPDRARHRRGAAGAGRPAAGSAADRAIARPHPPARPHRAAAGAADPRP